MNSDKQVNTIVNNISKFCSAVADKNKTVIKQYYNILSKENINIAIMTSIHDIYIASVNNEWSTAQKDSLLIVKESASRYHDHYGLLASNPDRHYTNDVNTISTDSKDNHDETVND